MRKVILASTFAILGLGTADAFENNVGYNVTGHFGFSERNDLPPFLSKGRSGGARTGTITFSTGVETRTSGYPRQPQFGRVSRGHNASDDFAVSDD
ncbi:hypothetical protein [Chelativorans sp. AA-79]|uniref:hypothetical protein n=1 Tax=Chelativorans sp. AA-79 TaxID=3028735 RepID=UPI0023F646B7|nr:hypothetical protein [Chelativorans sp. AA-79]WEX08909.1 hypothetical protein PVE73_23085 [Chelativorans sp. AA-79]